MLTFPDSPLPCEDTPLAPPAQPTSETASETALKADEETLVESAPEPPTPWATVVHRFTEADTDAYKKLNNDFGLTLDEKTFTRLQDLFCNTLRRDPTVGELFLLNQLDRPDYRQDHRRAVGELYTNSPAVAETWADMMAKHGELYAAAGLLRKERRTPPPCTLKDALTLIGHYLYRRGLVSPLTDGLPYGGKNFKGRTAVLCTPAQEADAVAEGYVQLKRLDFGNTTRSLWVRRGHAMAVTPAAHGDFLICLPSPDPEVLTMLLSNERMKKHPTVGAIAALSHRCPLDVVLSLCDGADIYPERLPRTFGEIQAGASPLTHLCTPPTLSSDAHPDYLLRVPAKRIREWIDTLRGVGVAVVPIGQVRSDKQLRIYLKQGSKAIPVVDLSASLLRTFPSVKLYRCSVEDDPPEKDETPSPVLLDLPEIGLTMVSTAVTVSGMEGYTVAMRAVSAAVSPLITDGLSTREIRLSVSILAVGRTEEQDGCLTGLICGLHRAAAEGGMAMENPALTYVPSDEEQSPALHLSVVAYRPSHSHPVAMA